MKQLWLRKHSQQLFHFIEWKWKSASYCCWEWKYLREAQRAFCAVCAVTSHLSNIWGREQTQTHKHTEHDDEEDGSQRNPHIQAGSRTRRKTFLFYLHSATQSFINAFLRFCLRHYLVIVNSGNWSGFASTALWEMWLSAQGSRTWGCRPYGELTTSNINVPVKPAYLSSSEAKRIGTSFSLRTRLAELDWINWLGLNSIGTSLVLENKQWIRPV